MSNAGGGTNNGGGAKAENKHLREQLERLSNEVLRANERIRELEAAESSQSEVDRLKEQIQSLENENKSLSTKLSHHKSAEERLRVEVDQVQHEKESLKSELREMQQHQQAFGRFADVDNHDDDQQLEYSSLEESDTETTNKNQSDNQEPGSPTPERHKRTYREGLLKDHQPMQFGPDNPFVHSQEMYIESRLAELQTFVKEATKLMNKYIDRGQEFRNAGENLATYLQQCRYRSWCASVPTLHHSLDILAKVVNEIQSYQEVMLLSFQGSFIDKLDQYQKSYLEPVFSARQNADSARVEAENALNRVLSIKRGNQGDSDSDASPSFAASDLQSTAKGALARGVKWLRDKKEGSSSKASKQAECENTVDDSEESANKGKSSTSSLDSRLSDAISALRKSEIARFEVVRKFHLCELEKRSSFVDATCGCLYATRAYFDHCSSYLNKVSEGVRGLQLAVKHTLDVQGQVSDIWQRLGSEFQQELAKTCNALPSGAAGMGLIQQFEANDEDPHSPLDTIYGISSQTMKKLESELRETRLGQTEPVASPMAKLASLEQQKSEAVSPTLVQIAKDSSKKSQASTNLVRPKSFSDGDSGDECTKEDGAHGIVKSGYLWKQSSGMLAQWQRRWFYVRDGKLWYLRGPHDVSPQLICELVVANIRELTGTGDSNDSTRTRGVGIAVSQAGSQAVGGSTMSRSVRPYVFEIQTPQRRPYLLQAFSRSDQREWVQVLRKHAESLLLSGNKNTSPTAGVIGGSGGYGGDTSLGVGNTAYDPIIRAVQDKNPHCADCNAEIPDWASVNLGVLLCLRCSGLHRSLGTHISKIKSLTLDTWELSSVSVLQNLGNDLSNFVWECQIPYGWEKPTHKSEHKELEKWIRAKYEWKGFLPQYTAKELLNKLELSYETDTLTTSENESAASSESSFAETCSSVLFMCAAFGRIELVQLCMALGADVNWKLEPSERYLYFVGDCNESAKVKSESLNCRWSVLHAAVYGGSIATVEFLLQNGARLTEEDSSGLTAVDMARKYSEQLGTEFTSQTNSTDKRDEPQQASDLASSDPHQAIHNLMLKRLRDGQA
eukprot:gb/GECG01002677.1/.p1 GENE.gb/GECG01002677.1/~~gb/GECG01002677.1/.p1  ORF type:complete len:1070 (+),score=145.54 gb/GECG01002677.1/:1-3210(+)